MHALQHTIIVAEFAAALHRRSHKQLALLCIQAPWVPGSGHLNKFAIELSYDDLHGVSPFVMRVQGALYHDSVHRSSVCRKRLLFLQILSKVFNFERISLCSMEFPSKLYVFHTNIPCILWKLFEAVFCKLTATLVSCQLTSLSEQQTGMSTQQRLLSTSQAALSEQFASFRSLLGTGSVGGPGSHAAAAGPSGPGSGSGSGSGSGLGIASGFGYGSQRYYGGTGAAASPGDRSEVFPVPLFDLTRDDPSSRYGAGDGGMFEKQTTVVAVVTLTKAEKSLEATFRRNVADLVMIREGTSPTLTQPDTTSGEIWQVLQHTSLSTCNLQICVVLICNV
jgi:hypothetical protein